MKKNKNLILSKPKGFTLIEFLVVIGIFIVFTSVVLSVFITTLRTTKQSDSLISVKQNGEHAIARLVRELRFAESLDYPSLIGGTLPVCSAAGISVPVIKITSIDASKTTLTCPTSFNYPNYIDLNGLALTNADLVVVKSCTFICTQRIAELPTIKILFSLSKINSNGLPENNTTIPFQTSVILRNINNQ